MKKLKKFNKAMFKKPLNKLKKSFKHATKSKNDIITISIAAGIFLICLLIGLFISKYLLEIPFSPEKRHLIGKWDGFKEEVNEKDNRMIDEYWIEFSKDGTFKASTRGVQSSGTYTIKNGLIEFHDTEIDMKINGEMILQRQILDKNLLELSYPDYRMKISYKKSK